jgi:hypothetical protein
MWREAASARQTLIAAQRRPMRAARILPEGAELREKTTP